MYTIEKWDKQGEHFFETGVDRGVLFPMKNSSEMTPGASPYKDGVVWNGLTSVSENPEGADENELYADNVKYLGLRAAENFGFTIGCYTYPDEFEECDGGANPVAGITLAQQNRRPFGFTYRTLLGNDVMGQDYGYKIHLVYNATASPSSKDNNTVNDSPEANELSYECSTTPVAVTGYKKTAHITIDSTKVDAAKLTAFESILYGADATTAPSLPTPDEVVEHFGGSATPGIELDKHVVNITGTGTATLNVRKLTPADATITWSEDSSSAVCTVADGVVTGVAAGSATVTATITVDGVDYTDTCTVIVAAAG